eukprot:TRINITY_DN8729_c0_g1_i1.p4 TRINITY_DN8729_c0_g1~~TRINITY_DN8729_c0_g1_i1.p4  ORF type:complete len:118 (-),score=24.48 TRINITY_DN8729_c0_g1_i1:47-400(-)
MFASKDMQNWEFKKEIEAFKHELISSTTSFTDNDFSEIARRTDEFLKKKGIAINIIEEEAIDEQNTYLQELKVNTFLKDSLLSKLIIQIINSNYKKKKLCLKKIQGIQQALQAPQQH